MLIYNSWSIFNRRYQERKRGAGHSHFSMKVLNDASDNASVIMQCAMKAELRVVVGR